MKKWVLVVGIAWLLPFWAAGQRPVRIRCQLVFGDEPVLLNDSLSQPFGPQGLRFETLKFYLSKVQLWKDEKMVFGETVLAHLLDASEEKSLQFQLQIPEGQDFNALRFYLGIDSLTQSSGALGGDLDPTRGMYWTWQSGYIHFKIEGKSPLCPNRNHAFQFHLGGYQHPAKSLQILNLPVTNTPEIVLILDLKVLFEKFDLSKTNRIMSPGTDAVRMSEWVAQAFRIRP